MSLTVERRPPALNTNSDDYDDDKPADAVAKDAIVKPNWKSPEDRIFSKMALQLSDIVRKNVRNIATNSSLLIYFNSEIAKTYFQKLNDSEKATFRWLSQRLLDFWKDKPNMVVQCPDKEYFLWAGIGYYLISEIPKVTEELTTHTVA